jgi:serine/threonine-protein kinase
VHRDIKPGNIMYDPVADTVKVTDFGIARITDASRTRTGLVLGTPSFMSPEQLAGQHIDGRSDLYSLGVTLFQLLTGCLPLRADSMAALMYQIANETPPDVRSLRPELPSALTDILGKAMSKAAKDRYQTGAEFAKGLLDMARKDLSHADPASRDTAVRDSTQAFEKTLIVPRSPEV